MLIKASESKFRNRVYRTKGGLFVPLFDAFLCKRRNIVALLNQPEYDKPLLIPASNIVTDAGDIYYAEQGAGEVPSNDFTAGVMVLGTGATATSKGDNYGTMTAIAASEKAMDAGYPQTSDPDTDNSGAGADVTSWLVSYTKADFNATGISEGCITNATPGASEPLLTRWLFASSFDKTANDTLKVFVNHTANGT